MSYSAVDQLGVPTDTTAYSVAYDAHLPHTCCLCIPMPSTITQISQPLSITTSLSSPLLSSLLPQTTLPLFRLSPSHPFSFHIPWASIGESIAAVIRETMGRGVGDDHYHFGRSGSPIESNGLIHSIGQLLFI